jgi:hypothetical protein
MLSHRGKVWPEAAVTIGGSYVLILVSLGGSPCTSDEGGYRILRGDSRCGRETGTLGLSRPSHCAREYDAARKRGRSRSAQRTTVGSDLPEPERSAAITCGLIPEG